MRIVGNLGNLSIKNDQIDEKVKTITQSNKSTPLSILLINNTFQKLGVFSLGCHRNFIFSPARNGMYNILE